jgi:glycine cleavage system aminomethyltransferase T
MDLTPAQQARLERIFQAWEENPNKLNDWANGFIESNQKNFIADTNYTGEPGYFVSPKMWKFFSEFEGKLGVSHEPDDQQESFEGDDQPSDEGQPF